MKKNQCKDALDIYKKFLYRMTKLSEFLKVAEQVGIDQGDIPDLSQAPSSLLEALEQHLASLEGKKTKELNADTRASTLSNAVSSLSSTGMSFSRMDEKEKQQALEEEQARLQALKDQRLKEIGMQTPPSASPSSQSIGSANNNNHITQTPELFSSVLTANSVPNLNSDLFDLQPAFMPAVQSTPSISTNNSAWGGLESQPLQQHTASAMTVDFDAVFGNKATPSNGSPQPAGFDALGDLLKPTVPTHSAPPLPPPQMAIHHGGKLLANDLDSSLANLVGSEPDMQWNQPGEKKLTGGQNWQNKTMSTTQWGPAPMAPQPMPVPHVAPAPMAFPMTTPQVPVYGMVPPQMGQMGGVPVMAPQPIMYNQPVLRPTNPFAPMPGAQQDHPKQRNKKNVQIDGGDGGRQKKEKEADEQMLSALKTFGITENSWLILMYRERSSFRQTRLADKMRNSITGSLSVRLAGLTEKENGHLAPREQHKHSFSFSLNEPRGSRLGFGIPFEREPTFFQNQLGRELRGGGSFGMRAHGYPDRRAVQTPPRDTK
ncbi:unnamed protein product, partial [Menidia menidia]